MSCCICYLLFYLRGWATPLWTSKKYIWTWVFWRNFFPMIFWPHSSYFFGSFNSYNFDCAQIVTDWQWSKSRFLFHVFSCDWDVFNLAQTAVCVCNNLKDISTINYMPWNSDFLQMIKYSYGGSTSQHWFQILPNTFIGHDSFSWNFIQNVATQFHQEFWSLTMPAIYPIKT